MEESAVTPGTLYIVATPIGNLADITVRALATIKQVATLLRHYDITTPTLSLHDHNERARSPQLVERLKAGEAIALISDAGTPLVSDPGWLLVHQAIEAGARVEWLPGAVAAIGALVLSGLPAERFCFEGFLPNKPTQRRKRLEQLKQETRTVVCYESPFRVAQALADVAAIMGDIPVACARELTKRFEEVRRGRAVELAEHYSQHKPRGEFVIVFKPSAEQA
jgi:16S rRNA (cytidine1402-2'-O)-methyltransferase